MEKNLKSIENLVVPIDNTPPNSKFYCYILYNLNPFYSNLTYNGSTNNLKRRLRQHNGEIVGGAKATSGKGPWTYLAVIEGFENHIEALCCEWKIKHPTGRVRPKKYCGIKGRIDSLNTIMNLDSWTTKSSTLNLGLKSALEKGKNYTVYLVDEVINLLDPNKIKPNVEIKSINELNDMF